MTERRTSDGVESPIRHEPLVSETLEENAAENRQAAERTEGETAGVREVRTGGGGEEGRATEAPLEDQDAPRKQHGDALETGTGTRHGVDERDERPRT